MIHWQARAFYIIRLPCHYIIPRTNFSHFLRNYVQNIAGSTLLNFSTVKNKRVRFAASYGISSDKHPNNVLYYFFLLFHEYGANIFLVYMAFIIETNIYVPVHFFLVDIEWKKGLICSKNLFFQQYWNA